MLDSTEENTAMTKIEPWHILIVDDESLIHDITRMALEDIEFNDKTLAFDSAYSAKEAMAKLSQGKEYAVVLLDVVMETLDAGFDVVKHLRGELGNTATRIIMRTGQPGDMAEEQAVRDYGISDYRLKSELTVQKLKLVMYSNLRTYSEMKQAGQS
jgi:CheY-like chemotaxis protein|tara:strand:+ start:5027 stop:5494 length:468 start_codon:yes stop_codon:yes gene_type:complete